MTSSYLGNKISDMKARFEAENGALKNDSGASDSSPFGSRPGSVRRPKLLVDGSVTPTRTRKKFDLPGSNFPQPINNGTDTSLLDQKMKEIMKLTGIITIDGVKYKSNIEDLELLGELGNGTCGHVVKMLHRPSQRVIAVKQMRRSGNAEENKRIAMDLEIVLMSHDCDYIVHCLGCFVTESDVWICMELMGSCFDKLIKRVVTHVPEPILGKVTHATVNALHYLKENHGVMHRDVKPSNILIDERGNVKLCDFGISGRLVDSKAKSMNAGCAAYMSPERINPADPKKPDYDIRADVWSLGITLVELATGEFPYPNCKSDFEVLSRVMQDDPPSLPDNGQFSLEFIDFIKLCLVKDYRQRPKYRKLLEHSFIKRYETEYVDVASWYACAVANQLKQTSSKTKAESKENKCFCGFNHENRSNSNNERNNSCSSRRKPSQDWEKLKGVWNNILKSPLFNRRKKTADKESNKSSTKEEETFRPPVSPLLLQRFLHQQIQHINGVRPHRSPSLSPKYNVDNNSEVFRYDELWMDERDWRGASVSPPVHPRRDQFSRHSSRNYQVTPSASWLVRSKSSADRSEDRLGHRSPVNNEMNSGLCQNRDDLYKTGVDADCNYINDRINWRTENRISQGQYQNSREDLLKCRPDQTHYLRMNNQPHRGMNDRGNLWLEDHRPEAFLDQRRDPFNWASEDHSSERQSSIKLENRLLQQMDDNFNWRTRERINPVDDRHRFAEQHRTDELINFRKKSLEDQLNQRIIDLFNIRLTEQTKHPDQIKMEERLNRRALSPGTSSSPEPPPRINKRVSPLLARRIAYNNSRLARLHQSPCLPRRYNVSQQSVQDQNGEVLMNSRSTSLPCSPVLSPRNYSFDIHNYPLYHDFSP